MATSSSRIACRAHAHVQGGSWLAPSHLAGYHVTADAKEERMQDDDPTLPPRLRYEPVDAPDPDAFSEAPTWPPAGERPLPPLRPDRSPCSG